VDRDRRARHKYPGAGCSASTDRDFPVGPSASPLRAGGASIDDLPACAQGTNAGERRRQPGPSAAGVAAPRARSTPSLRRFGCKSDTARLATSRRVTFGKALSAGPFLLGARCSVFSTSSLPEWRFSAST
jgi:hypothetical protein